MAIAANTPIDKTSDGPIRTHDVLIVDDDANLCRMLTSFLSRHGWNVHSVHTGRRGLEISRSNLVAMILLDIGLPDCSGFEILREIQRSVDTPVIVISARGEETDRIVGLELGADDYLVKPFSPRELLARMSAVARRAGYQSHPKGSDGPCIINQFTISVETHEIFYKKIKISLSTAEFQLLRFLLQRAYEVCSRELLVRAVLYRPFEPLDRSLDMHILRIRRKLEVLPGFMGGICTVRNGGYMFTFSRRSQKTSD
ncbi:response regulator transcription factor [Terriglobus sp. RCC_193]|uniref:response regulator transcription factor n=1 Tax=Terriglobus sp. RCC_193 TaxID=3239218 RepID=UPI003524B5D6